MRRRSRCVVSHCTTQCVVFEIGIKMILVVLFAVFAATSASMVNLTSEWRKDIGWEVTCVWGLVENDSLMYVRLMDRERQFFIYRPEISGSRFSQQFRYPEKLLTVHCYDTSARGLTGHCVMILELYQPVEDDMKYACEVSGERPRFLMERKDIEIPAIVPPSDAEIEVAQSSFGSKVILNCTSSGLPAPNLVWSVGKQRMPQELHGKTWDTTSKLWQSWSSISYHSTGKEMQATCIPETSKGSRSLTGKSAVYSAANELRSASSSMVNLTSEWRADYGWEVRCAWRLLDNDSLQSVRLMDHERQFLIYRPEITGTMYNQQFQFPEKLFQVECHETSARGVTGLCVMSLELYQPVVDDMRYACEVSGERPTFRVERKDIDIAALVSPSNAVIDVAQRGSSGPRVVLNCTSSGLPAPNLIWHIGEQKVPQDFHGKTWNMTSKLWQSWSLLSYTSNEIPAVCTPETNKGSQTVKGESAEYSAASGIRSAVCIILGTLPILALIR